MCVYTCEHVCAYTYIPACMHRVKNASSAGYKFGHLILHTYKGYELIIPVNHNPLYVLAAVGNLGASVVPFRNRSNSPPVAE